MAADLFNEAYRQYSGKDFNFSLEPLPTCGLIKEGDIEEAITFKDFVRYACREPQGVKSCSLIFDYHLSIPEFGSLHQVGRNIEAGSFANLPPPLRPKVALPDGAKMGAVIKNNEDGTCEALKVIWLAQKMDMKSALALCSGRPLVAQSRDNWLVVMPEQTTGTDGLGYRRSKRLECGWMPLEMKLRSLWAFPRGTGQRK